MPEFLYQIITTGKRAFSRETERERVCVCERDGALLKVKDSVSHKMDS
jgi:hypothetical protein